MKSATSDTNMVLRDQAFAIFNQFIDPIFLYSKEGRFVFINDAGKTFIKSFKGFDINIFFDFFQTKRENIVAMHDRISSNTARQSERIDALVDIDATYLRYMNMVIQWPLQTDEGTCFMSTFTLVNTDEEIFTEKEVFSEKYERLLELLPAKVWITNRLNRPIYTNKACREFFGLDFSKIETQKEFEHLIHEEDHKIGIVAFNEAVLAQKPFRGIFRMRVADGSFKWVEEEAVPQYDKDGHYLGYSGQFNDIDELKQVQFSLSKAENDLSFLFNQSGMFICKHSVDGTINNVSAGCKDILGYDRNEMVGKHMPDLVFAEDLEKNFAPEAFKKAIQEHAPLINRIRAKDGTYKWIEMQGAFVMNAEGTPNEVICLARDISERKEYEQQLLLDKKIIETSTSLIVVTDKQRKIEWVNDAFCKISGYTQEELKGQSPGKMLQGPDSDPKVIQYIREKLDAGEPFECDTINYSKSGTPYWVNIRCQPIYDETGEVERFFAIEEDITEKRKVAKEIERNEQRLKFALEGSMNGVWDWDLRTNKVFYSSQWKKMQGYSDDEISDSLEEFSSRIHPDDVPKTMEALNKHLKGETTTYENQFRLKDKAGNYHHRLDRGMVIERDQDGKPLRMIGTNTDISPLIQAQEILKTAASFPEYNPNPVIRIHKKSGMILYKNKGAAEINRIFFNGNVFNLAQFCFFIRDNIKEGSLEISPVEVDRDYYVVTATEIAGTDFINVYSNNITELTNTSMRLTASERKFRFLAENAKDLICLHNAYDQFLYVSPSVYQLLQYTPEEMGEFSMESIAHPHDQETVRRCFQEILETPGELRSIEVRLRRKNGAYRWFEIQMYPVVDDGEIAGIQSSARDITEQKQAEFNLRQNELKYRNLIDNMDLGYLEVDINGLVSYTNHSFCQMTRYTEDELIGHSPADLILPDDKAKAEMEKHDETRKKAKSEVYQMQIKRKDGVLRTLLISGAPVINEEGNVVGSAGIHWDISPLLEMELRLYEKEMQRQKNILQASIRSEEKQKQTLGRELHDGLGQLLAYISINLQLMLDKGDTREHMVKQTKELLANAIAEVRQLSRTLIPVALDSTKSLSEVVSESLMLYANMKGTKFDISLFDPEIDAKLSTDQKHIVFRILQELTNNTIKYAEATQINIKMESKKGHCVIDYTDNGKGFNVKKVKSGVGLESIQTRIESVNGTIHISSRPGHGSHTSFTIPYTTGSAQEISF